MINYDSLIVFLSADMNQILFYYGVFAAGIV